MAYICTQSLTSRKVVMRSPCRVYSFCFRVFAYPFMSRTPNPALYIVSPIPISPDTLQSLQEHKLLASLPGWIPLLGKGGKVTSSITTEFPLMTTIPIRTFSPPAFSSTASSRTMFRKTYIRRQMLMTRHRAHPSKWQLKLSRGTDA